MANALKRYQQAKAYEQRDALLIQIHTEIEPKLASARAASDLIDRIGSCASGQSNRKGQGFVFDLGKYSVSEPYAMGRETEPADLGCENDARYACIVASAQIPETKNNKTDNHEN